MAGSTRWRNIDPKCFSKTILQSLAASCSPGRASSINAWRGPSRVNRISGSQSRDIRNIPIRNNQTTKQLNPHTAKDTNWDLNCSSPYLVDSTALARASFPRWKTVQTTTPQVGRALHHETQTSTSQIQQLIRHGEH